MHAYILLHMHITVLATVSTATATVTQKSETEWGTLNTSSSLSICHGVGPLVDPFRSRVLNTMIYKF
jgi:hypothetical protein